MTTLTSGAELRRRPARRRRVTCADAQLTTKIFDRDYWLRHCEGYRVDGIEGRLGFVDSIREAADGAPLLAVRAGRLGRRLLLVRATDAAFIVPRAERIWLASPAKIVSRETA